MKRVSLRVVGLSHVNAPLHVRELCALPPAHLYPKLQTSGIVLDEYVVLSTCNRLEVYALCEAATPVAVVSERILALFEDAAAQLEPYVYSAEGVHAASHLFRVVCGLDSAILGEVQILGQVRREWQLAHQAGVAGPMLSHLFNTAVALGKRVHTETAISRHPASMSYAAVVLARQIFGEQLAERKALVIGSGDVGEGVVRCLDEQGVQATVVAHRHVERAQAMARRYRADTVLWDELLPALASSDLVISSTTAPHYILQRQHIVQAMRGREGQPLYLIDLAVPRDIAPDAAEVPGVHLHNVDDLLAVVRSSLAERQSLVPEVEAMVDAEVARFASWWRARVTAPLIREAHAQADALKAQELQWALAKLSGLDEHERRIVEALASRLVGKLLHGPIQWLKAQAESGPAAELNYEPERLAVPAMAQLFYRRADEDDDADDDADVRATHGANHDADDR